MQNFEVHEIYQNQVQHVVMVERVWSQNTKRKIKAVILIDALEKMVLQPKRSSDTPFHMSVCGVDRRNGVATGRIEQGKIV